MYLRKVISCILCASMLSLGMVTVQAEESSPAAGESIPVAVDYSVSAGTADRVASGMLHAFDYHTPAEWLTDGVYIKSIRGQAHHKEFNSYYNYLPGFFDEPTYNRLTEINPDSTMMIGLYYGYAGKKGSSWKNASISNGGQEWKEYIHTLMSEAYDENGNKVIPVYSWIPYNEPDLQWGSSYSTGFFQGFQYAYEAVKDFDARELVQGPENTKYNKGNLTAFLSYCKEHDCLPDVLSWHELTNSRIDIEAHCKELTEWMTANGIEPMPFAITEYQGTGYATDEDGRKKQGNYNTGLTISYLAMLERSAQYGLAYGLQSSWGLPGDNSESRASLGDMSDFETETMPTGLWYVYHKYKEMTGVKPKVTVDTTKLDAIAAADSSADKRSSQILIGNWEESEKTAAVTLSNIPDYLKAGGTVHIKVERINETLATACYGTDIISNTDYTVSANNSIELSIPVKARSAAAITITPPSQSARAIKMSQLSPKASDGVSIVTKDGIITAEGITAPNYLSNETKVYNDTGAEISFTVTAANDGIYHLSSTHKTGTDKGFMQMYVDGESVGNPIDLYSTAEQQEVSEPVSQAADDWEYTINDISINSDKVTVNITKNSAVGGTVIAASYSESGALIGASQQSIDMQENSTADIELECDTDNAERVAVYIWDNISGMKPLGEKKTKYIDDVGDTENTDLTVDFGNIYLAKGDHTVTYKSVGFGKNEASTGYALTFGSFTLAPVKDSAADTIVSFNANREGASLSQNSVILKSGEKLRFLPDAECKDYVLTGWNTVSDGSGDTITTNTVVSGNITAYAQWKLSYSAKLLQKNSEYCTLTVADNTASITITPPDAESKIKLYANNKDISTQLTYTDGSASAQISLTESTVFSVDIIAPLGATVISGNAPILPTKVNVELADGTVAEKEVTWDTDDITSVNAKQTFEITGTYDEGTTKAKVTVLPCTDSMPDITAGAQYTNTIPLNRTYTSPITVEFDWQPTQADTFEYIGFGNGNDMSGKNTWGTQAGPQIVINAGKLTGRNGTGANKFTDGTPYELTIGETYRIRMEITPSSTGGKYSAWYTAPNGSCTQFAKDYGFRSNMESLSYLTVENNGTTAGSSNVSNFKIYDSTDTPVTITQNYIYNNETIKTEYIKIASDMLGKEYAPRYSEVISVNGANYMYLSGGDTVTVSENTVVNLYYDTQAHYNVSIVEKCGDIVLNETEYNGTPAGTTITADKTQKRAKLYNGKYYVLSDNAQTSWKVTNDAEYILSFTELTSDNGAILYYEDFEDRAEDFKTYTLDSDKERLQLSAASGKSTSAELENGFTSDKMEIEFDWTTTLSKTYITSLYLTDSEDNAIVKLMAFTNTSGAANKNGFYFTVPSNGPAYESVWVSDGMNQLSGTYSTTTHHVKVVLDNKKVTVYFDGGAGVTSETDSTAAGFGKFIVYNDYGPTSNYIDNLKIVDCAAGSTTTSTATPTIEPTATPTIEPTATPTTEPTATPTTEPTTTPTTEPTATPTTEPTTEPTATPTYTVTWKNGETKLETDENVTHGSAPNYNGSTPVKESTNTTVYTFSGWKAADANGNPTGDLITSEQLASQTITADITYLAQFTETARTYTVTYNKDSGTIDNENSYTSYTYGQGLTLPTPSRSGYTFNGWYSDNSFTSEAVTAISTTDTGDKTYYAKWTQNESGVHSVTLNTNGGTINGDNITNYTEGTGATLPTDVTKDNYTFDGWYDNADCTGTAVTEIASTENTDKQFWAKWTPKTYSITYNMNGHGTAISEGSYKYGTAQELATPETVTGYTFGGWYANADCIGNQVTITTETNGNITVYAKWTAEKRTVTFNTNGGSTIDAVQVDYNTAVTQPANPTKNGYTFAGWQKGSAAYDFGTLVTENITLTASWNIVTYTITYSGTDDIDQAGWTTSYTVETGVTLPKPEKADYIFRGWYNNDSFTGEAVTSIAQGTTGNKTYYAKWTPTVLSYIKDETALSEYQYSSSTPAADAADSSAATYTLDDAGKAALAEAKAGDTLTISYDIDNSANSSSNLNNRHGFKIAGKQFYVNCIGSGDAAIGDWPDGSGIYFMNSNPTSGNNSKATVTYTFTLAAGGNATALDVTIQCGSGTATPDENKKITFADAAVIDSLILNTVSRNNKQAASAYAKLTNFKAVLAPAAEVQPEV